MCGDDLTRENVMKQAASLKDLKLDMLLPGMTINTSPIDFAPIKQEQLARLAVRFSLRKHNGAEASRRPRVCKIQARA